MVFVAVFSCMQVQNCSGFVGTVAAWVVGNRVKAGVGMASGTVLGVLIGICYAKMAREKKARLAAQKDFAKELKRQQERFDALPINDFAKEADRKIEQVRSLLKKDYDGHRGAILAHLDQLQAQSKELASQLEKRRAHLAEVQKFFSSVRDEHGDAFLEKLVHIKTSLSSTLETLTASAAASDARLGTLKQSLEETEKRLAKEKTSFDEAGREVALLAVNARDARLSVATSVRDIEQAGREFSRARSDMNTVRSDISRLAGEAKGLLHEMESVLSGTKYDREALKKRVEGLYKNIDEAEALITRVSYRAKQAEDRMKGVTSAMVVDPPVLN